MKKKDRPRFDLDALRELAGDKVFARGEVYHRDGSGGDTDSRNRRACWHRSPARRTTATEVTGRSKNIDGACSCPAFEDWGFCKHMVATALAANAAGSDAQAEGSGAIPRIRNYLKAKGADALVELVMEAAGQRDHGLLSESWILPRPPHPKTMRRSKRSTEQGDRQCDAHKRFCRISRRRGPGRPECTRCSTFSTASHRARVPTWR